MAVAREQDRLEGALDRACRGGMRRVGDDLPRRGRRGARLDAVRPGGFLSRAPPISPRARRRDDAVLVTCAYLMGQGAEWVEKSLMLAAIGEARDQGAKAIEAFAYRYPRARARRRAVPRPPHGLPARLPRGFRIRRRCGAGAGRAVPARARRPRARRGGSARQGAARRAGGVRARPAFRTPPVPAADQRQRRRAASVNVPAGGRQERQRSRPGGASS